MMAKTKLIEIPEDLYDEFLKFLDSSQSLLTEAEVVLMDDKEKQVLEVIDNLLGDTRTPRHKDQEAFLASVQNQFNVDIGLEKEE